MIATPLSHRGVGRCVHQAVEDWSSQRADVFSLRSQAPDDSCDCWLEQVNLL
jgi:hypothetical protein